jgi:hypothetical protein
MSQNKPTYMDLVKQQERDQANRKVRHYDELTLLERRLAGQPYVSSASKALIARKVLPLLSKDEVKAIKNLATWIQADRQPEWSRLSALQGEKYGSGACEVALQQARVDQQKAILSGATEIPDVRLREQFEDDFSKKRNVVGVEQSRIMAEVHKQVAGIATLLAERLIGIRDEETSKIDAIFMDSFGVELPENPVPILIDKLRLELLQQARGVTGSKPLDLCDFVQHVANAK